MTKHAQPDVPNARLWIANPRMPDPNMATRFIAIECERWVDARTFARVHFGVPEVEIHNAPNTSRPRSRFQVRWEGNAVGRVNTLRLRFRRVTESGARKIWKDIGASAS